MKREKKRGGSGGVHKSNNRAGVIKSNGKFGEICSYFGVIRSQDVVVRAGSTEDEAAVHRSITC